MIEIDEAHHDDQKDDDLERQKEIIRILLQEKGVEESKIGMLEKVTAPEIKPGKDMPEFFRIATDVPYDKLEEKINKAVEHIITHIHKHKPEDVRWLSHEEKLIQLKNKGKISKKDHFYFKTIEEICNTISPESRKIRKCYFEIKNASQPTMLWCPKLALRGKDGDLNSASDSGWVNELVDDVTIREWNADSSKLSTNDHNHWLPRPTFLKVKTALGEEGYRFIGIFERQPEDDVDGARLYKRTSDSYSWSTADARA